jgi:monoamine oxidase
MPRAAAALTRRAVVVGSSRATSAGREAPASASGPTGAAGAKGQDVPAASVAPEDQPFGRVVQTSMGPMESAVDFNDLSTMDRSASGGHGSDLIVKEGYGTRVVRSDAGLPVRLRTAATRDDWQRSGLAVETPAGTIGARACIVTVSRGSLASGAISFAPEVPR